MKLAVISVLSISLASGVMAQLTPGPVVSSGEPFPIIADFNGDGLDDLIQERNVLINDGSSFSQSRDFGLGSNERVVGALDFNGDRILDLLTETTGSHVPPSVNPQPAGQQPVYLMYPGDGLRNFGQPIQINVGARPYIADVDGDSKDDFVILDDIRNGPASVATEATVLRSRGDGTFERLASFRLPPSPQIVPDHRILSGDLNHDGRPDLVIRFTTDLAFLFGTGGGRFDVETRYVPWNGNFGTWSTRLGDIDGDSNDDVIIVGVRRIRVLFGDGRGKFPRSATAAIAKTHDIAGLPAGLADVLKPDDMNQPRNLAVGHFTRTDREQIAAGTVEGDLVLFSYEQGALREVSRTTTEFWALDIRPGAFRAGSGLGVYVAGTLIWGEMYPRPRVFHGAIATATPAAESRAGRRRASQAPVSDTTLRVQLSGICMGAGADRWTFVRDGIFGEAQHGPLAVEAVFDEGQIFFRLSAPFANDRAEGVLVVESDGVYRGTANVLTSCGWKVLELTARRD